MNFRGDTAGQYRLANSVRDIGRDRSSSGPGADTVISLHLSMKDVLACGDCIIPSTDRIPALSARMSDRRRAISLFYESIDLTD